MAGSEQIALELEGILRTAEELRRPIELANARLEDYDAVYYPGATVRWKTYGRTPIPVDC
jgi:hypothetical protein